MPYTRGSEMKQKEFTWVYDPALKRVQIRKLSGPDLEYSLEEVSRILRSLYKQFGHEWIMLANNVEKLSDHSEKPGLGMTIMEITGKSTTHGQGASYLGVVFEETGFFEWNGKSRGICWKIRDSNSDASHVASKLKAGKNTGKNKNGTGPINDLGAFPPFSCPDSAIKGRQAPDRGDSTGRPKSTVHAPSDDSSVSADDLGRLRRLLLRLLDVVEPRTSSSEGVGARITRLSFAGKIPREIAALMRVVTEMRNASEYQAKTLSASESLALRNNWNAITEWAGKMNLSFKE